MGNPRRVTELWFDFKFVADPDVWTFVNSLDFVARVERFSDGVNGFVHINPLYDPEEAWLLIYGELDNFVQNQVDLDSDLWCLEE